MEQVRQPRTALVCRCAYGGVIPEAARLEVLALLQRSGDEVIEVEDLCGLAARRDPLLTRLVLSPSPVVAACEPRAVRWLFHHADVPLPADGVSLINMRSSDTVPATAARPDDGEWVPWFPVIDYERCSGCQQCASFCLFDVFRVDSDGTVVVNHPRGCKTNCPACARICPEAAIIFPKIDQAPINGAEITSEEEVRANIKVNMDEILGDDVYAALQRRQKAKRRRLLRQDAVERALAERERCLCEGCDCTPASPDAVGSSEVSGS